MASASGVDLKRKHSDNWSSAEVEALIGAVEASRTILFGKHDGAGGTQQRKKQAWEGVAASVCSAGGGTLRTPLHCKDKFGCLKKALKKRALDIKKNLQRTGGGSGGPTPLTDLEERVLGIAGHVAIYGIPEGSSSSSPKINPSKSNSPSAPTSPLSSPSSSSSSPQHPPTTISHQPSHPASSSQTCAIQHPPTASSASNSSSTSSRQKKRKMLSLIGRQTHFLSVEDKRLAVERERLEVEKQRLAVEQGILKVQQERLDVERQRLAVEYERLKAERHERMGDLGVLVTAVEAHEH